jgi:hypothetical protein
MNHEPETPTTADEDVAELDDLADRLCERLTAGEYINVERCAAEHPTIADSIRGLVPTMYELMALAREIRP